MVVRFFAFFGGIGIGHQYDKHWRPASVEQKYYGNPKGMAQNHA